MTLSYDIIYTLLHFRANPATAQYLYLGNQASVRNSNWDSSKITVVIAHGWNGHGNHRMNKMLTEGKEKRIEHTRRTINHMDLLNMTKSVALDWLRERSTRVG